MSKPLNAPSTLPFRGALAWSLTLVLFVLALSAFVFGPIFTLQTSARRLPLLPGEKPITGTFAPNATYFTLDSQRVAVGIQKYGSWRGTNLFTGRSDTGWYKARARVMVLLSGYPREPGNEVSIVVRKANASEEKIVYQGIDPRETWTPWEIALPADAAAFKVVAIDGSKEFWLGHSDPSDALRITFWNHVCSWLQVWTTTLLALVVLQGPGLVWILKFRCRPARWAEAALIGPVLMAVLGLLIWIFGGYFSPRWLGLIGVFAITLAVFAGVLFELYKQRPEKADRSSQLLFVTVVILVGLAVSKATLSIGPEGELFGSTISRTLSPSGHPDSRISYCLVQVIAQHLPLNDPLTIGYYAPWRLTSRGPLAGLIAAPVVLSLGTKVTPFMPDQPWSPFDHTGFAAYRITLIVLASLAAWVVFGLLRLRFPAREALWGTTFCLLAPLYTHELFFTWPKLIAGAHVLLAFVFIQRRHRFLAGVCVALGYLYHPMAILSAPFLGLWALRRDEDLRGRHSILTDWLIAGTQYSLGLAVLVAPWLIFDHFFVSAHMEGGQKVFLNYFSAADDQLATVPAWLLSRWHNFAYTFIPGYYLTVNPAHSSINSIYGPSDSWVRNIYLYWKTLPFGFGFAAFCITLPAVWRTLRSRFGEALILFIGPAALIIVYWGAADTGFLSYCGHYLFLAYCCIVAYSTLIDSTWSGKFARDLVGQPWFIVARLLEIAIFCYATTFHHTLLQTHSLFFLDDLVTLSITIGLFIGLYIVTRASCAADILQPPLPAMETVNPHSAREN